MPCLAGTAPSRISPRHADVERKCERISSRTRPKRLSIVAGHFRPLLEVVESLLYQLHAVSQAVNAIVQLLNVKRWCGRDRDGYTVESSRAFSASRSLLGSQTWQAVTKPAHEKRSAPGWPLRSSACFRHGERMRTVDQGSCNRVQRRDGCASMRSSIAITRASRCKMIRHVDVTSAACAWYARLRSAWCARPRCAAVGTHRSCSRTPRSTRRQTRTSSCPQRRCSRHRHSS